MSKIKYRELLRDLKDDNISQRGEFVINSDAVEFPKSTDRDNTPFVTNLFEAMKSNSKIKKVKILATDFKDRDPDKVITKLFDLLRDNKTITKITIYDLEFAKNQEAQIGDLLYGMLKQVRTDVTVVLNGIDYTKAFKAAKEESAKSHMHEKDEFVRQIAKQEQEKKEGKKSESSAPIVSSSDDEDQDRHHKKEKKSKEKKANYDDLPADEQPDDYEPGSRRKSSDSDDHDDSTKSKHRSTGSSSSSKKTSKHHDQPDHQRKKSEVSSHHNDHRDSDTSGSHHRTSSKSKVKKYKEVEVYNKRDNSDNSIEKQGYLKFDDLLYIISKDHEALKYINFHEVDYHVEGAKHKKDLPHIKELLDALKKNTHVKELYMNALSNIKGLQGRENITEVLKQLYKLVENNNYIKMISLKKNELDSRDEEDLMNLLNKKVVLNTQNNDKLNYMFNDQGQKVETQIHLHCSQGVYIGPEGGFEAYSQSKEHKKILENKKQTEKESWDFKYQQHAFGHKFATFSDMVTRIEKNNKHIKMFDLDKINYTLNKDQYKDYSKEAPHIKNLFQALKYNTHVKQLYLDEFQQLRDKMHGVSDVHKVMEDLEHLLLSSSDKIKHTSKNNIEMVSLKGVKLGKDDIHIIDNLDRAGVKLDLDESFEKIAPNLFRDCTEHFKDYSSHNYLHEHSQLAANWEWHKVEISGGHGSSDDYS